MSPNFLMFSFKFPSNITRVILRQTFWEQSGSGAFDIKHLGLSTSSLSKPYRHKLDIFETPVTVTPQQEISETLNSSKIPSKHLTF